MNIKKKNKKGGSIASDNVNSLMDKKCDIPQTGNNPILVGKNNVVGSNRCFSVNNYSTDYKTTGGKRIRKSNKNKKGGRVWMPKRYFDPESENFIGGKKIRYYKKGGCSSEPVLSSSTVSSWDPNGNPPAPIRDHLGDSLLRGASIPENSIQKVNDLVNGKETILSDLRGDPSNPASLQLACSGSACGQTFRSDIGNNDPAKATVSAKDFKIPVMSAGKKTKKYKKKGGGSDWRSTVYSRGSYTAPDMSKSQFKQFSKEAPYIPNSKLANGAAVNNKATPYVPEVSELLSSPGKTPVDGYDSLATKQYGKGKKKRKTRRRKSKSKRGGGSDWMSTVYSRGSYTAPNMSKAQFKQFSKEAPYVANTDLANGAAKHTGNNKLVMSNELLGNPGNNPVKPYNSLTTKQFGKGKYQKKK